MVAPPPGGGKALVDAGAGCGIVGGRTNPMEADMPWTTPAVVFGSWFLILVLTLLRFFVWSPRLDDDGEDG
jgi:hypothetical protein